MSTKIKNLIITGSSGFIGSNIFYKYANDDFYQIYLCDRKSNIHNEKFSDFIKPDDLVNFIMNNNFGNDTVIFHQGACSNTMELDYEYMMSENYEFSKNLLDISLSKEIKFIYASSASVYGNSDKCIEEEKYEHPLNIYAESKLKFDNYVRKIIKETKTTSVVGLRYFNVYGNFESEKGLMASQIFNQFLNVKKNGYVEIFGKYLDVGDGEQKRDFIYVQDICDINNFFKDNNVSGIFNAGSGTCETFNNLSLYLLNSIFDLNKGINYYLDTKQLRYSNFPKKLIGKYQNNTSADLTKLKSTGYHARMTGLKEGIEAYLKDLKNLDVKKYS